MKKNVKKTLLLLMACAMLAYMLSGCSAAPDSKEDPLAAFEVDAMLPFATTDPDLIQPTPTPAPTLPWQDATTAPIDMTWRNESLPGDNTIDEPDVTNAPTKKPSATKTAYSDLRKGDEGTPVKNLQKRLAELNYYNSSVNGKFGDETVKGVKNFQIAIGMNQTGIATAALQEHLFAGSAPTYQPTPAPTKVPAITGSGVYYTLEYSNSGPEVWRLQERLKELGFYKSFVDGVYGSGTESAVKSFQRAVGQDSTGVASVSLQKQIFSSAAPTYKPMTSVTPAPTNSSQQLSQGAEGSSVKKLQQRLKDLGYFRDKVDGAYGNATTTAVRLFQRELGMEETGVATAALQNRLYSSNAPVYSGSATPVPTSSTGYVHLSPGDTGNNVKKLQTRLKELGYFDGDIGGNYLSKTTDAVKKFQKTMGLEETGVATVALQQSLFASNAPRYSSEPVNDGGYSELRRGASGSKVESLQKRFAELGYFSGTVDGNFGDATESAVRAFERAYGREETGVATVALQKKLFATDAKPAKNTPTPKPTDSQYVPLSNGDTGERVKTLQRRLKELGYFDGDIGGNYLSKTTAAVKLFQKAIGVTQNGNASVDLQKKLFASDAPYYASTAPTNAPDGSYTELRSGDSGQKVENLQYRLMDLGYYSGTPDGSYGEGTVTAVKLFEAAYGKTPTGTATVDLQKKLFSVDAKPYVSDSTSDLKKGDSGENVTKLQLRLIELGYLTEDGTERGTFDQNTYDAVLAAQKAADYPKKDGTAYATFLNFLYSEEGYTISLNEYGN